MTTTIKRNEIRTWHKVAGNLEPIGATLKDQTDAVIDLTGKTVAFRLVRISDKHVVVNDSPATIVNPGGGTVQYQPSAGDTDLSAAAVAAGDLSESLAMYFKIHESGKQDVRLPYDGARWTLVLHDETDG
jgi:hypothetical protein